MRRALVSDGSEKPDNVVHACGARFGKYVCERWDAERLGRVHPSARLPSAHAGASTMELITATEIPMLIRLLALAYSCMDALSTFPTRCSRTL